MNIFDKTLRKVSKEITVEKVFSKLNSIYLAKSLFEKVHLKHRFYSFKLDSPKVFEHDLDNFKRLTNHLDDIDHKVEYGRNTLSIDFVIFSLRYKDL